MYQRVLVPLDGSKFAETALPLALEVSRSTGATVELVTVHEPVPSFAYEEWEKAARSWSEKYLSDVQGRVSGTPGVSVETAALSGRVGAALERRVQESGADLVVMATHGRGGLSRAWLGSIADSFVRHAPCPVLLVRPEEGDVSTAAARPRIERILIALDGSELSEQMLPTAVGLGEALDARYVLGRVVAYPVEIASPYLPHTVQMNQDVVDEAERSAASYLEEHARTLRARGLAVETAVVVDTQAGHGILRLAEESEADVIAMATHGRGGFSRAVLGSAADKVIRGAHRPVFVYRPTERTERAEGQT